ncbi:MAG: DNA mismatch endonuclease Vsr [Ignavibacteriales bacterium]|nr:DNA mismatch endonuclease Vsr [Ignavibacteriales bacterium]
MKKIQSKNTKPELLLRSKLFAKGFRFRLHKKDLPGKPDIVLPKYKSVIFVHGCFWHKHENCIDGRIPSSNTEFWKDKIQRNIRNDELNIEKLRKIGWKVYVVWECEVEKKLDLIMRNLISQIVEP